ESETSGQVAVSTASFAHVAPPYVLPRVPTCGRVLVVVSRTLEADFTALQPAATRTRRLVYGGDQLGVGHARLRCGAYAAARSSTAGTSSSVQPSKAAKLRLATNRSAVRSTHGRYAGRSNGATGMVEVHGIPTAVIAIGGAPLPRARGQSIL